MQSAECLIALNCL